MNMMRTALLIAGLTAIFVVVGGVLGGAGGMMVALLIAIGMNAYAWWNSDRLALAAAEAHEVGAQDMPELVSLVADLARRAGLPMPRVYLIDSDQPNAFATGRDPAHAAVAVNIGLIRALSHEELAGVLAHELAHVRNRDTLTMSITATLAGAVSSIAHWGMFLGGGRDRGPGVLGSILVAVTAPLAAMLVQMAVSRGREYEADKGGAEICGNPLWLARALEKIAREAEAIPNEHAEAHPAMAHMYIINPLTAGGLDSLFSTHPKVENRVAALERLARGMGLTTPPPRDGGSGPWGRGPQSSAPAGSFLGGGGIFNGSRRGPDR